MTNVRFVYDLTSDLYTISVTKLFPGRYWQGPRSQGGGGGGSVGGGGTIPNARLVYDQVASREVLAKWGKMELYPALHRHHQNDSSIKMGGDAMLLTCENMLMEKKKKRRWAAMWASHVSLILRGKVTRLSISKLTTAQVSPLSNAEKLTWRRWRHIGVLHSCQYMGVWTQVSVSTQTSVSTQCQYTGIS